MTPLELLHIDETDLAANRAGHLSPRQLRRLRRRAAIGIVFFALCGALMAFIAISSRDWFVPAMLALACFGFGVTGVRVAAGRLRESEKIVRRLTGPVTLGMMARGWAGNGLRLVVGGESCPLPSSLKRWRAALTEPTYHVYVLSGALPEVVGIEPAT